MTGWCEVCHGIGYHHPMCCYYEPKISNHVCRMCKEPICDGEVYIRNDKDEYLHYDCADKDDVIKFFSSKAEIMEVNGSD